MSRAQTGGSRPCLNCGDTTPGNYCPLCGQSRAEVRVSLRRLLSDVLEDQLSISSALPRTLVSILFRPGHATNEYLRGRIASYIAPFRLYLVTSLVFFLLLSLENRFGDLGRVPEADVVTDTVSRRDTVVADDTVTSDSVVASSEVRLGRGVRFTVEGDSLDRITGIEPLDRILADRLQRLGEMEAAEVAAVISPGVLDRLPVAIFLLVPLVAFFLKVLYLRTGRYYVDHFIFALHVHAFAFILFTVMMPVPEVVARFTGLVLIVYTVLAMKRVYAQSWVRTLFKWSLLAGAYSLSLAIAVVAAVLVAVVTM